MGITKQGILWGWLESHSNPYLFEFSLVSFGDENENTKAASKIEQRLLNLLSGKSKNKQNEKTIHPRKMELQFENVYTIFPNQRR